MSDILATPMFLAPGTRLGPCCVTTLIGKGGMGEVYQTTDTKLNRRVALKVLLGTYVSDPGHLLALEWTQETTP